MSRFALWTLPRILSKWTILSASKLGGNCKIFERETATFYASSLRVTSLRKMASAADNSTPDKTSKTADAEEEDKVTENSKDQRDVDKTSETADAEEEDKVTENSKDQRNADKTSETADAEVENGAAVKSKDQKNADKTSKTADAEVEDGAAGKSKDQRDADEASKTADAEVEDGATEKSKDQKDATDKSKDDGSSTSKYVTRGNKVLRQTREEEVNKIKEKFLKMKRPEKRKLYKCKENFTTLDDVETWPKHFRDKLAEDSKMEKWWKINKKKVAAEINNELNSKMSLFCGDITTLEIDAIANAANESLLGGGGVDGAIHAASGSNLRNECELLRGCEPGDAKITCGYKLPAKYVIHTVGPRGEYPKVLKSCYETSLNLLKENNLTSIAFPCISTGIFGYPNANAAKVALYTIRQWLEEEDYAKNVERIIMCLFLKKDIDIYDEQMQLFFPLDRDSAGTEKD
ncbi:O-acetyl-ADP-ribose deacetylase macrod2 [Plakobranchus ocellatus]|uniref:O-acetyl-ADP-ribose deacetylase macrod2 n=1 Tax=Plakobranchus ocellatus TaxID=259542 RepID=A0AAV4B8Y0_9GAST|nr:O-acetyl-ADP-ribose deacetylase macrod2 [Plakobranchus ocellatus]